MSDMCIIYNFLKCINKQISKGMHDTTTRPKIGCYQTEGYSKNYQRLRHIMLCTSKI